DARLLDVEDLAAEGEDGLEAPVTAHLGRPAGRVSLDDVQLTQGGVALGAVGELSRQRGRLQQRLALHQVARPPRSLARPRCRERLLDDPAAFRGILIEELAKPLGEDRRYLALHLRVAELGLGLTLELRF